MCVVQPLLDLERNGANLHYNVWWRRKDSSEDWNNVTTVGTKHVVHHTDTYVPYEIRIQAANEFGPGPVSNVAVGFSGEDGKQMWRGCTSVWNTFSPLTSSSFPEQRPPTPPPTYVCRGWTAPRPTSTGDPWT